jgi:uncharacterized protein
MSRDIYVNLPVENLDRSVEFFTKLGFEFDTRMTDENATRMIVNDRASVMLLTRDFFKSFTKRDITDTTTSTGAIFALSADDRPAVDDFAEKALDAGATQANEPLDHGFMYGRSFHDLDGHLWEIFWMDEAAAQ